MSANYTNREISNTHFTQQTKIIIPKGSFPSDDNFIRRTTMTYEYDAPIEEIEFLKEIIEYVVANSDYEIVDCNEVGNAIVCTIRLEK